MIIGLFLLFILGVYTVYALIECEVRAHAPKKVYEPNYQFSKIVVEEEPETSKTPSSVIMPKPEPEEEEEILSVRDQAKEWILENADLVTEMTRPSYEEGTFLIKKNNLNVTDEVKNEIVLLLMEVYATEIRRAGIDRDGNIAGELNN